MPPDSYRNTGKTQLIKFCFETVGSDRGSVSWHQGVWQLTRATSVFPAVLPELVIVFEAVGSQQGFYKHALATCVAQEGMYRLNFSGRLYFIKSIVYVHIYWTLCMK